MALGGGGGINAFSILDGDDAEDLLILARVSTAPIVKLEKRNDSNHLWSSLDHEKSSDSNRQNKKRNGAIANNQRKNNVYVQDRKPNNGLKRSSNYQRKQVVEDEDGWQTVGGRSTRRRRRRREIQNCNETEFTVFKQLSGDDQSGAQVSPENANASDSKEGPGNASCPKQDKEIEARKQEKGKELEARKLERILEAKKMTLKQYENLLREKRKVLESMKTQERRVALDTDFYSMHIIANKSEEEPNFNSSGDKQKKTIRSSFNAKKIMLPQPPPRRPTRDNASRNQPDASPTVGNVVILPPPSFEDVQQFPALA